MLLSSKCSDKLRSVCQLLAGYFLDTFVVRIAATADKAYMKGLSSSPKRASLDQGAWDIQASLLNDKPEGCLTAIQLLQHPGCVRLRVCPTPLLWLTG